MTQRTVADIMEKTYITAQPETSVFDLVDLFVQHNVSVIPIVRGDGSLAGIVTEADLVYKKMKPHMTNYANLLGKNVYYNRLSEYDKGLKKKMACEASELMTTGVIVASPEATIEQIAGIMIAERLKTIPVVQDKKMVGIITRRNILQELYQEYKG